MKKIMVVLCIVYGTSMIRAAHVQVVQPDAMTVSVINKNKPTIVNQNNPTIKVIGKDDPFNASNPIELKFRMRCLSQAQLQEKLATIDNHQLKLFLNTLCVDELHNLLKLLGEQGQSYIINNGNRFFLNTMEDAIVQAKKREEESRASEKEKEESRKKDKVVFIGIIAMYIAALAGGTIYA